MDKLAKMTEILENIKGALEAEANERDAPYTLEELKEAGSLYLQKHQFRPGDIVRNKSGLSETKLPIDGQPAIVLEVMLGRRSNNNEHGHRLEFAPNEIRIGVIKNGSFHGYWADANRFEPFGE
jgi:hypothetical protein